QQQKVWSIERFIAQHRAALVANDAARAAELRALIRASGIAPSAGSIFPIATALRSGAQCVVIDALAPPAPRMQACGANSAQWWCDARGAFHHTIQVDQCLTARGANELISLADCDTDANSQRWQSIAINASARVRYEPDSFSGQQTLDNFGASPGIYGIHGGPNQQWDDVARDPFPLLAKLSASSIRLLRDLGF
ncbi:MAG: hypothetical protein EAZ21_03370, partial [Betaproteobacteria bacterium]